MLMQVRLPWPSSCSVTRTSREVSVPTWVTVYVKDSLRPPFSSYTAFSVNRGVSPEWTGYRLNVKYDPELVTVVPSATPGPEMANWYDWPSAGVAPSTVTIPWTEMAPWPTVAR